MGYFPRHIINLNQGIFLKALRVVFQGKVLDGADIERFEKEFAEYIKTDFALGVSQARLGFIAVLKALGLEKGDEIILSAYNFHIIPEAVVRMGFVPVFVDIEPDTYTINPELIKEKINNKTRAIIVTHMFGQPADMDVILPIAREKKIKVIEDCAHAAGSEYKGKRVGIFGDAAIFSFSHGKNMPCLGGGMITTNDRGLYKTLKKYVSASDFPKVKNILVNVVKTFMVYLVTAAPVFTFFTFPLIKLFSLFNYDVMEFEKRESISRDILINFDKYPLRLTNLQAVIGLKQIEKVDDFNRVRFENAKLFTLNFDNYDLSQVKLPKIIDDQKSIYLYYNLWVKNKKFLRKQLLKKGIDSSKNSPMSDCSSLSDFSDFRAECPVSASVADNMVEIANNHFLTKADINYISTAIKEVIDKSCSKRYYRS